MKQIVFALPGNEWLAERIITQLSAVKGETEIRHFPDGESYVRVGTDVLGCQVILISTLDNPDSKLIPVYFLSSLVKELGAAKVTLVAPYLPYMRQDKRFKQGEAITSYYFSRYLSGFTDELITIDPHLHRKHALSDLYTIPCQTLHTSGLIADYIIENIKDPLIIGPDSESEQWISEIARRTKAPYIVLEKTRTGDKEVKIKAPRIEEYINKTPVLVDDIISTARTMIETVLLLKKAGMQSPVCIGIHGIFAENALNELTAAGAKEIITANTIRHESNKLDITDLLVTALRN